MSRQEVHEALDNFLATAEYNATRARDQAIVERDAARRQRDQAKALGETLRVQCETALQERGMFRNERDAAISERDALYARLDEAHAERNKAFEERDKAEAHAKDLAAALGIATHERDALRERLEALDETIAMVEMPNIPWTASGNKDRQGRPARTVVDPSPVNAPHKGVISRVQDLIEAMRNWDYCGDALLDDPAIYGPLDALTDTLGMPRTPPVKERAPIEPVKVSEAGPMRPNLARPKTWLPGTPEQDPADPLRIEYVESVQFAYDSDSAVRVVIETNETDGGIRRLSGHSYHSALVITAKELLDMACWTHEAETKNTAARVRREVADNAGEKRFADGFNAGYDQGLADARKEMRDAQEGDDR